MYDMIDNLWEVQIIMGWYLTREHAFKDSLMEAQAGYEQMSTPEVLDILLLLLYPL